MNRREFIKSLGLVSAATGVGVATLTKEEIKPIEFELATLKRSYGGYWHLEFTTSRVFSPDEENGIVVEIGEHKFFLKDWQSVEHFNFEGFTRHRLSGSTWEKL